MTLLRFRFAPILFLPAAALAHGTESGGLVLGSLGSVIIVSIGLAVLPTKAGRKLAVLATFLASVVGAWTLALSAVGDWMFWNLRQSLLPWILLGGGPPFVVASLAYYFFARPIRPSHPATPNKSPEPTPTSVMTAAEQPSRRP